LLRQRAIVIVMMAHDLSPYGHGYVLPPCRQTGLSIFCRLLIADIDALLPLLPLRQHARRYADAAHALAMMLLMLRLLLLRVMLSDC